MRTILSGLTLLTLSCSTALAAGLSGPSADVSISLIQYQGNTITRSDERPVRPQRYVCVVPPRQSDNRNSPYVCRAQSGRVGGACRCENVVGTGRLDLTN
ncbi:hypothetical protein EPK99_16210 [Neorhizobium lilium]|uniref:Uncharacterized protein n=1 Tax=Neorhizobium lilium TaxID=2503024 RepID=A0A3S4UMT4_9HYPH|nr:hypothetical protein [Neorhizobium lilium]RWX77191.1 hypothetical protein EPK99_16210 [Neorhizobium lilium]